MDTTTLNTIVTIVGIGVTVVAIVLGVMGFRRRRVKPHWTTPAWKMVRVKVRTMVVPVLRVDWGVRGHADIHDVLCTVSGPQGNARDLTWPNGTVQMGKDFFTYVSHRRWRAIQHVDLIAGRYRQAGDVDARPGSDGSIHVEGPVV